MFARKKTGDVPAGSVFSQSDSRLKWVDLVLPHLCGLCREPVVGGHNVCGACWPKLQFVTKPQCSCCGLPFGFDLGDAALCAKCIEHPPQFESARAALKYDDHSKQMILGFKHGDKMHLRMVLAKWMMVAGKDVLQGADILAAVPLHWTRLLKRKYNQAGLLSSELARLTGIAGRADLLLRCRRTTPHEQMTRAEREKNVRAAFELNPKYSAEIAGRCVVVVDDVMTTGATVNECAKTLLSAGAGAVRVLTAARVAFDT